MKTSTYLPRNNDSYEFDWTFPNIQWLIIIVPQKKDIWRVISSPMFNHTHIYHIKLVAYPLFSHRYPHHIPIIYPYILILLS